MQFPRSLLLALVSALAAYAQTATGPNAFTNVGLAATAGQEVTLTWYEIGSGSEKREALLMIGQDSNHRRHRGSGSP